MKVFTKEEFESLTPYRRGYAVYWYGANPNQPNVPNEPNPYQDGSEHYQQWNNGMRDAVRDAQDSEE